jgi:hypothetical protein
MAICVLSYRFTAKINLLFLAVSVFFYCVTAKMPCANIVKVKGHINYLLSDLSSLHNPSSFLRFVIGVVIYKEEEGVYRACG